MSLDRNADTKLRIRRNSQRTKDGAATATIGVTAPIINSGTAIALDLSTTGGLQVSSGKLAGKVDAAGAITLSSSGFKVAVDGTTLEIATNALQIKDLGVSTAKLAASAVTTAKIADANVTTVKIADLNVTTGKLADNAVTTAKITDANVTTVKIADLNVTTGKLADLAVTAAKIAADAVTTTKILDANVTAAKLASDSVTTVKILDANVTAAKLATDAVTTVKIADLNVTTGKLAASAATFAKLSIAAAGALEDKGSGATGVKVDGTTLTINGSNQLAVTFLPTGDKNAIINGNFNFWQRGTAGGNKTGSFSQLLADRWKLVGSITGTVSQDRSSASTPDSNSTYAPLMTVVTNQTIASGTLLFMEQTVEGYNFLPYAGKAMTLSFWVRSSVTGTFCVAFQNSAGDRSYVAEYTISAASTWEYKTITLTHNTTGSWVYDDGVGMRIRFGLSIGSSVQGSANAWTGSNILATSNQVNWLGTSSATFRLSRVQLELGSTATAFEARSIGAEYLLVSRYYAKSYNIDVVPGTVTQTGFITFSASGTGGDQFIATFPTRMRAAPTLVAYSAETGTSGQVRDYVLNADQASTPLGSGTWGLRGTGGAFVDARIYGLHYTADAEL